jgi:hypothetical protein
MLFCELPQAPASCVERNKNCRFEPKTKEKITLSVLVKLQMNESKNEFLLIKTWQKPAIFLFIFSASAKARGN